MALWNSSSLPGQARTLLASVLCHSRKAKTTHYRENQGGYGQPATFAGAGLRPADRRHFESAIIPSGATEEIGRRSSKLRLRRVSSRATVFNHSGTPVKRLTAASISNHQPLRPLSRSAWRVRPPGRRGKLGAPAETQQVRGAFEGFGRWDEAPVLPQLAAQSAGSGHTLLQDARLPARKPGR